MKQFIVDIKDYSLDDFKYFLKSSPPVVLSDRVQERIIRSRKTLENILARKATTVNGINTGFGKLSSVRIADNEHESLQRNLIRSHAVGIGPPLNAEAVRLTMLLKILSLCQGYSGVRMQVVERLQAFLNGNILPIIPSQGSVGASGDLAALAATEMGNIGERRIFALLNGNVGLPAGLISKPGLNSGFMMVQVTAAALAVPASLDVSASPWTERPGSTASPGRPARRNARSSLKPTSSRIAGI